MRTLKRFIDIDNTNCKHLEIFTDMYRRMLISMVKNGITVTLVTDCDDQTGKEYIDYYTVNKNGCFKRLENMHDLKIWYDGYLMFHRANNVFFYKEFKC